MTSFDNHTDAHGQQYYSSSDYVMASPSYGRAFASGSKMSTALAFTPYSHHDVSTSSSSATTPSSPSPPWMSRRASYSSTNCSSDTEDEELETPPTSPQVVALSNADQANAKGKGKAVDVHINHDVLPFSLHEDEPDHDAGVARVHSLAPAHGFPNPLPTSAPSVPSAEVRSTSSPTSTATTLAQPSLTYPPGLPIPPSLLTPRSATSTPIAVPPAVPTPTPSRHQAEPRPRPQPSPPSRQAEESQRGRSRWPRLLWSSQLDEESLRVLRSYHHRVVGGPLPVLEPGMSQRDVRKWSHKMEDAGL